MKCLYVLFIFIFILVGEAKANSSEQLFEQCRKYNSEWYECKRDRDCKIINDPCGWPREAANKQYSEEANKCNRLMGVTLNCVQYSWWDSWFEHRGYVAKCINNQCVSQKRKNNE